MRQTVIAILTVGVLVLVATTVMAQEAGHSRSVEDIVGDLIQSQGTDSIKDIDPAEVPPALLEELGDAVMGVMIADDDQHEWMDQMMGGEDSEPLSAMHRWIGYNYIEANGNLRPGSWGVGMMGRGMMGSWTGGMGVGWTNSHMRWAGPWVWIIGAVVLIIAVGGVVLVVRATRRAGGSGRSTLDILKGRYVRGEISREEFRTMREELR